MAYEHVDDTSYLTAAQLNKMPVCAAGFGTRIFACRVFYDGGAWDVGSEGNADDAADLAFNWNATTDELEIDLTGLEYNFETLYPAVLVSATASSGASGDDANHYPHGRAAGANDVRVRFYDDATGAQLTAVDTQMNFNMLLIGKYTTV